MKRALTFSAAVCGISFLAAIIFHLATGYTGISPTIEQASAFRTFASLYMFLPLLTAIVLQAIEGNIKVERRALRIRITAAHMPTGKFRPHWSWLAGSLLAPVVVALSILFSAPFADIVGPKEGMIAMMGSTPVPAEAMAELDKLTDFSYIAITLLSGLLAGATINALFAYGEEYGWRGYMAEALGSTKFWKAALVIGFVWGLWHLPLILMGHNGYSNRALGVVMMILFCLLAGVVELYLTRKSGTLWAATIFHGTINALAGLGVLMIPSGDPLITGATGVAGLAALVVVIAALYIYDRYISRDKIFG
ncbi:MAG: CPBP family intramembrane metalloprotease [Tidjanibacter sp.]|nr:CPBP family intramembrane metalloprotease [Tidjanibacter sp.]